MRSAESPRQVLKPEYTRRLRDAELRHTPIPDISVTIKGSLVPLDQIMRKPNPRFSENLISLNSQTKKRRDELNVIELEAIANYSGKATELASAIGMLYLGDHLGWKALLIIHNKRTIRKYEEILNIEVREFFDEEGPCSQRSMGYFFASKLSNYWKAVSGDVKVENRKEISN